MSRFPLSRRFLVMFLSLAGLAFGAADALRAEDVKFPADGSGIVMTLPEGWKAATEADGNISCNSADGKIEVKFLTGEGFDNPKSDMVDIAKTLIDAAKLTDVKAQDQPEHVNANGVKCLNHMFQGKNQHDVVFLGLLATYLPPKGNKILVMMLAPSAELDAHGKELEALAGSIKLAK